MNFADITILILGLLFIAAYIYADQQRARANRLQAENERVAVLHAQYLKGIEDMKVANAEIERYNEWLEWRIGQPDSMRRADEIAAMMTHKRVEWEVN